MFLFVKKINDEDVIIGTAQKMVSAENAETTGVIVYEILDSEFKSDMISAKLDSFDVDEET